MAPKPKSELTFTQLARRKQIIARAVEVIAEVGYAQASIRKIAKRVGVAMSAVLFHFETKDQLVEAIVEEMYRSTLAMVVPAVDAETTATGKLSSFIRANVEYFDSHRAQVAALAQLGADYQSSDGRRVEQLELSAELTEQLPALAPNPILQAGQRDGEFGDFPVDSTALALHGALTTVVEKILRSPTFDVRGYGEDLVEIFGRIVQSPVPASPNP